MIAYVIVISTVSNEYGRPFGGVEVSTFLYSSLVNHVGRYFYIFTEIYRAGMIFRVKYPPGKQFDEILPGGYDF